MPSADYGNNRMFNPNIGGNTSYMKFTILKQKMSELGYELMTADNNSLKECEGIIFHEHSSLDYYPTFQVKLKNFIRKIFGIHVETPYPTRKLYKEAIGAGLRDKLLLILWEARATFPLNFSPELWDKFDHILTCHDDLIAIDPKKFKKMYLPMEPYEVLKEAVPFKQKKLLVTLAHNKFYSSHKNELFKERRKLNTYFEKHYPNEFDLYGLRWNRPITRLQIMFPFLVKKYANYRGHAEDKIGTLSKYKFNMCYENISDAPGYIADKIFSSFHARAVPIYWGAPNVTDYIDADTFVDRRKFKNNDELAKFLTEMTEKEYNKYLMSADRFMKSEKYAKFLPEDFCNRIITELGLKNQNK